LGKTVEHGEGGIGGSGENFEDVQFSGGEIDAIGESASGIDGYAQMSPLSYGSVTASHEACFKTLKQAERK
jgi:hypothetical protein